MPCCDMSIGRSTRAGGHVIHLGGRHINTARIMCVVIANGTGVVVDSERGLIDYRPAHPARQGSSRRLGERHTLTPLSTPGEIPSHSLRPFPVTVLVFHTYSIITPAKPAAVSPPQPYIDTSSVKLLLQLESPHILSATLQTPIPHSRKAVDQYGVASLPSGDTSVHLQHMPGCLPIWRAAARPHADRLAVSSSYTHCFLRLTHP